MHMDVTWALGSVFGSEFCETIRTSYYEAVPFLTDETEPYKNLIERRKGSMCGFYYFFMYMIVDFSVNNTDWFLKLFRYCIENDPESVHKFDSRGISICPK